MNSVRRIAKNSGASFLTQVSTPASSFVLVFFIARLLGVSELGKYSAALSLLFIFQAISSLGFPYLITREVALNKAKAGKYLINASFFGSLFSILTAGIMCFVINLIANDTEGNRAGYILSISLVPYTLSLVCQSISRGFEKLEHITIAIVIGNAFKLLLGLIALFKGYGLLILLMVITGSHFLIFFLSLFFTFKSIPKSSRKVDKFDIRFCKWIIGSTHVFALILIISTIRMNIDVLILNKMMGELDVGIYSAANKLVYINKLGITSGIFAIQPVIFRLYNSSLEKFKLVCIESIRYALIMITPIIFGTMLLSDKFVLLVFNEEFLPSAYALSVLIWLLIMTAFNQLLSNMLVASNYQKINLYGNIISMISNICLNILLIPKFSFIGASIANVTSALIILVYQYRFISSNLFKLNYLHFAVKPFVSAIFMGLIVFYFRDLSLMLLIPVSALVYLLGLISLNTFSESDKALFRKLWKGDKIIKIKKNPL